MLATEPLTWGAAEERWVDGGGSRVCAAWRLRPLCTQMRPRSVPVRAACCAGRPGTGAVLSFVTPSQPLVGLDRVLFGNEFISIVQEEMDILLMDL
jgi:hypothetical protein